jgi:hypothetical protein
MKKLLGAIAVAALFVLPVTGVATASSGPTDAHAFGRGDWETLVERHAEHAAYARTWEQSYTLISFYGGATYLEDTGITFRLSYSVRCRGGFERTRTVTLIEDPTSQYYRGRLVRVPRPSTQGKCTLEATATAMSPWQVDVTIGIAVK